jgi:hypothetical protein
MYIEQKGVCLNHGPLGSVGATLATHALCAPVNFTSLSKYSLAPPKSTGNHFSVAKCIKYLLHCFDASLKLFVFVYLLVYVSLQNFSLVWRLHHVFEEIARFRLIRKIKIHCLYLHYKFDCFF